MLKTFKVDLDYESYLFDPQYVENQTKYERMNKEFEYVFFFINQSDCILKNSTKYSDEYLNLLKSFQLKLPALDPNAQSFTYWWGQRENKALEQVLNSKLTSSLYAKANQLGFQCGEIVESLEEVEAFIQRTTFEKYILRNPFSFSGIGHYIFNRDQIPLVKFNHQYLLEPLYDRVIDLGITFEIENLKVKRMFIVLNFNNELGSFKGGLGARNNDLLLDLIFEKYGFDLRPHLEKYQQICEHYLSLNKASSSGGINGNIQIDSFIYREDSSLKLYPLVEVNFRKTMGLLIQSLADHFLNLHREANFVEWRITHLAHYEKLKDWTKISPETSKFNSYFKLHTYYKD